MANSLLNSNGTLNVENYNAKVSKQREVFSRIDSTMAILEKLPDFVDSTLDILNANSFTFSVSPLGFLFNILHSLGVSDEKLREWITEILVYVLPTVEVGIKASLLANIKGLISCNSDPRIPLYLRKKVSDSVYTNILTGYNEDRGIDINVDAIDPDRILDLSPFTEPGSYYYFGVDDSETSIIERMAKLVRADDFNAFLWYVIHKGNKQNPINIAINNGMFTYHNTTFTLLKDTDTLMGVTKVTCNGDSDFVPGTTIYDISNPNIIAICIEANKNSDGKVTGNTFVNVSSDWFSCNWYVDTTNYYSSNIGIKDNSKKRDYSKEKAICNLRFCKQYDYRGEEIPNYPNNIRFTILPKPYVILPSVDIQKEGGLSVQWRPIRLLFDAKGNSDQKGKFSLISETYDLQPTLRNENTSGNKTTYDVYGIVAGGAHQKGATLEIDRKTGEYRLTNITNLNSILVECYPGLTVYEFNYDYIMGMKLFDPKVVCQRIFDAAGNPKYNTMFNLTLNRVNDSSRNPYLSGKQKVMEIVQKILEEDDDDELNDCFYMFSNEKYDEMLRMTEEIRYRQLPYNQGYNKGVNVDFSEATKILLEYSDKKTLEEQKEIINRSLKAACDAVENGNGYSTNSDKSTLKADFLTNILQQLVAAIVDSVLSPKVLMLLVVNKALMDGQSDELFDSEELMRILKNVVKALVKEVRDLIMKKLLDYIIEYLTPLALQLQAKILSEQFAAYMAIIKLLLAYYNKGVATIGALSSILSSLADRFSTFNSKDMANGGDINLATILDDVNYADIYPTDKKDNQPILKNC